MPSSPPAPPAAPAAQPGGGERLRVTHVVGGTRTGCTAVVLGLLRGHDRARIDPSVCFFTVVPAEAEVVAAVTALGVAHRDVVKRRRYDPGAVPRLARALRELGGDVVVLHGFGAYSFGAVAARLAGRRAVVRVEHNPELYGRSHELASRASAQLCDSTILVSRYLGEYLVERGTRPPRPEVIENGVELGPLLAIHRPPLSGPGPATALMAARLDPQKDHATLLGAMAILGARGVPLRLRLAGTGVLEGEIRAQVRAAGLEDRVELLGHRADMPALLEAADLAVLSTRWEGFGLVVAEAMAAGRPVVATAVASIPELVEDGRTGLLVPAGSAERLADALASLCADPARARALGEAGRARAIERFGRATAVAAFERHVVATARRAGLAGGAAGPEAAPGPPPAERSPAGGPPTGLMSRRPASPTPLRVLHVINDLGMAGAEQVVLSLVAHRAPHVTCAVARLNDVDELDQPLRDAGATVCGLDMAGALDLPRGLLRLGAEARRFRPHLIHTHLLHAEILGGALAHALRIPVLATVHNVMWSDPATFGRGGALGGLYRRTLRGNDLTVGVVDEVARLVIASGVAGDKVTVIPNGIAAVQLVARAEARRRLGLPEGALVVGAVGNLFPYKGHDLLVAALARLLPSRPGLHLCIIGHGVRPHEGGCREALEAQARALGIADRLHLPGRVPGAASLLAAFDVYAQPSRTEAASIALLEALSAGLPAVTTSVGGTPAMLGDSGAARLVPPDDVEALAGALAALLDDEAERRALSERARRHAGHFGASGMVAAYEQAYLRLLGRTARAAGDSGDPSLEVPLAAERAAAGLTAGPP